MGDGQIQRQDGWDPSRRAELLEAVERADGTAARRRVDRLLTFSEGRGASPTFGTGDGFPSATVWFTVQGRWVTVFAVHGRPTGTRVRINLLDMAKAGTSGSSLTTLGQSLASLPKAAKAFGRPAAEDHRRRPSLLVRDSLSSDADLDRLIEILGGFVHPN